MVTRDLTRRGTAWATAALVICGTAVAVPPGASPDVHHGLPTAQRFERTPYDTLPGWDINVYRAGDTQAFLRCSAEKRYGAQSALTVARSRAGYVLGFTSTRWPFDDGSSHESTLQVDDGELVLATMRARLLPSGPIGFVDVEPGHPLLSQLTRGRSLAVQAVEVAIAFDLDGADGAVAAIDRCFQEHVG